MSLYIIVAYNLKEVKIRVLGSVYDRYRRDWIAEIIFPLFEELMPRLLHTCTVYSMQFYKPTAYITIASQPIYSASRI